MRRGDIMGFKQAMARLSPLDISGNTTDGLRSDFNFEDKK